MKVFAAVACFLLVGSAFASSHYDTKWRTDRVNEDSSSDESNMNALSPRNTDEFDLDRFLCNGCILMVNGTKYLVEQRHQTIDFLRTELLRLTRRGPCPHIRYHLEDFIIEFGNILEDKITHSTPEQVCLQSFASCSKGSELSGVTGFSFKWMCPVCQGVMAGLKLLVNQGIGQDALISAAKKACSVLPVGKDTCKKWVEQYGNQLLGWLTEYPSKQVCKLIHAC